MCNAQSKDFAVSIGVKQGCVLALTRFSLYLTAMLEVAFRSTEEGVYIHDTTQICLMRPLQGQNWAYL